MENQKAQKIADIREHYKTEIDAIQSELRNADILKNEKLRDILFAKEIENFNKNENKQVQNLNDYIVNDIIDRLVNEIYEQIKTNNCSFDDFKLKISLDKNIPTFFQSNFNIKKRKQKSQVISIFYDFDDKYKEDAVTLPPRKQLFNIGPLTRICVDRAIINEKFKIKIYGNGCRCQFQENFGENNKNKQPELILEKDDDVYNIILNNNDTITISKEDSEENDQQKLIDEIQ